MHEGNRRLKCTFCVIYYSFYSLKTIATITAFAVTNSNAHVCFKSTKDVADMRKQARLHS